MQQNCFLTYFRIHNKIAQKQFSAGNPDADRYGTRDGPGKGGMIIDVKEEKEGQKQKSNCCRS